MGLFRRWLDSTTSKRLAWGQKHNHQTVVVLASHSRNWCFAAPIQEDLTVLRLAHLEPSFPYDRAICGDRDVLATSIR